MSDEEFNEILTPELKLNRLQLDEFGQEAAWGNSQAHADEQQVFEMLGAFATSLVKILPCCEDVKDAMNKIGTRRNLRGDRSIMKAAQELAAESEHVGRLMDMLQRLGLKANTDVYQFNNVWVSSIDFEGDIMCLMTGPDGVYRGSGDGYHRNFDETSTAWDKIEAWLVDQKRLNQVASIQEG
jgi:hypothetical protein